MSKENFIEKANDSVFTQCNRCKHRTTALKCAAFPKEIPRIILTNKFNHKQPYPGDNGIQFEEKE